MTHPPHPLASAKQAKVTPSRADGVEEDLEGDLRVAGCMLIQELGILLEMPQSTSATAQVLLQRFFFVSSLLSYSVNEIAIGAVYLASKLTESQVRLRDLLNAYVLHVSRSSYMQGLDSGQLGLLEHSSFTSGINTDVSDSTFPGFNPSIPSFHNAVFYDLKDAVVVAEMQILKRLGFEMQVDLPYGHMINYCRILNLMDDQKVVQLCWGILNDALQTPAYALHTPATLACFAIFLSARLLSISLPARWWILFDVEWVDLWGCCGWQLKLWKDWGSGYRVQAGTSQENDTITEVHQVEQSPDDSAQGEQILPAIDHRSGHDVPPLKEARWRRAWQLAISRKYVRRYIEEQDRR